MQQIIAFAGSNSKKSINKKLASHAASMLENVKTEILDLNNFNLPMYGIDYEEKQGIPNAAKLFFNKLEAANGIIISLAEHNGAYTTVFKNLLDWLSRIDAKFFQNKPVLLLATSPGARGGASVLKIASDRFPYHNANIIATFSLPEFQHNFSKKKGITHEAFNKELRDKVAQFKHAL